MFARQPIQGVDSQTTGANRCVRNPTLATIFEVAFLPPQAMRQDPQPAYGISHGSGGVSS